MATLIFFIQMSDCHKLKIIRQKSFPCDLIRVVKTDCCNTSDNTTYNAITNVYQDNTTYNKIYYSIAHLVTR